MTQNGSIVCTPPEPSSLSAAAVTVAEGTSTVRLQVLVRGAALDSAEPLFFTYVSEAAKQLILVEAAGTNSSCPALLQRASCSYSDAVGEVSPVAPRVDQLQGIVMVARSPVECDRDCMGLWGGAALFDDCGECSGGTSNMKANASKDCQGVCFGPFKVLNISSVGQNVCACEKENSFQCSQMERRVGPTTKAASLAVLDW
jgi:hypothetical protein